MSSFKQHQQYLNSLQALNQIPTLFQQLTDYCSLISWQSSVCLAKQLKRQSLISNVELVQICLQSKKTVNCCPLFSTIKLMERINMIKIALIIKDNLTIQFKTNLSIQLYNVKTFSQLICLLIFNPLFS